MVTLVTTSEGNVFPSVSFQEFPKNFFCPKVYLTLLGMLSLPQQSRLSNAIIVANRSFQNHFIRIQCPSATRLLPPDFQSQHEPLTIDLQLSILSLSWLSVRKRRRKLYRVTSGAFGCRPVQAEELWAAEGLEDASYVGVLTNDSHTQMVLVFRTVRSQISR